MGKVLLGFVAVDAGENVEVRINVQEDKAAKIKKVLENTDLGEVAKDLCDQLIDLALEVEEAIEDVEEEEN